MTSTSFRRASHPGGRRPRAWPWRSRPAARATSPTPAAASGGDAVTLNGGGATSQAKAQGVWRAAYQDDSGNTVNYEEVGSGTGRENFNSKAYVFAGTDSYLNDDEGELTAAKERCGGTDAIEVPAYVSPIAVAFNLPGVDTLNMSSETIANIFNGTITKWNDQAIAADNDGVDLPSTAIATVHRSDDSGTTANFTDYLSKTSNGAWTDDPDDTWPADSSGGQGARGHLGRHRWSDRHGGLDRLRRRQRGQGHRPRCGVDRRGQRASTPRRPTARRWSWLPRPGSRAVRTWTWPSTSTARSPMTAPTRCC